MTLPVKVSREIAALPTDSEWDALPDSKRQAAEKWATLVRYLVKKTLVESTSITSVVDWFLASINTRDDEIIHLAKELGRNGKPPSRGNLIKRCKAYQERGIMGLVPKHKGSAAREWGWESRALFYWQKPSKPSYQLVAEWLEDEGHDTATYERVRRYIKSLPADYRERGRIGRKLFDNTRRSFIRRTTDGLAPGAVYQGDGNTLDVYLQHPTGKKPWRAELTLWIDVASRYVTGWYLSEAESGNSTLYALSHALFLQEHIPAYLHIDNGSGYKNMMMSDEATGFYSRLGISIMHSRPYNAKGKGHVERFFGTMQRKFLKQYDSFCGPEMDKEALQTLLKRVKKGEVSLPTRAEWIEDFIHWLERYHTTSHRGLDGKTPAEVWEQLERFPIEEASSAIFWPRKTRSVSRQSVRIDNREYSNAELLHYNGGQVIVEYALHRDDYVRILDNSGRWICDASLIQKQPYISESRIVDAENKRKLEQTKRLAVKQQEIEDRSQLGITHDQVLESAAQLVAPDPNLLTKQSDDLVIPSITNNEDIDFDPLTLFRRDSWEK